MSLCSGSAQSTTDVSESVTQSLKSITPSPSTSMPSLSQVSGSPSPSLSSDPRKEISKLPTSLGPLGGEVVAVQAMNRPESEMATAGSKPSGTKPGLRLG